MEEEASRILIRTMKVRWGVLGAARIGLMKVIPAMQAGEWSEIVAIASRDLHKAKEATAAPECAEGVRVVRGAARRS